MLGGNWYHELLVTTHSMHGHIVIITETVSVYSMINFTSQFDDIGVVSIVFSRFLH